MKTILPQRSFVIKEKLDQITEEILAVAKARVAMIMLFGSYARGDWVKDEYVERHITYSYVSDLDIMVVVKGKNSGRKVLRVEDDIGRRLERKGLRTFMPKEPSVTMVVEHINSLNRYLEQGQYFFSDIRKEGILLYDSGEFQLSGAKDLSWEERREIAAMDYGHWFKTGSGFFINANGALQRGDLNNCAFELHQATEGFYNTILLVFSGYKPKLHDIRELRSITGNYNETLWSVFPHSVHDNRQAFGLLERAYIEARYNRHYIISHEQLVYLISEVKKLQRLTEKICLEYINKVIS